MSKEKLTKQFFMSIPKGLYLVSHESNNKAQPVFAELLAKPEGREEQWKALELAGASGKRCYVSESQADFDGWHRTRREKLPEG